MHIASVSEILGCCESQTRSDDTLDCWMVGEVKEQCYTLHRAVLLEILSEETCSFHVYTHSCENYGEVFLVMVRCSFALVFDQASLTANLSSNLGISD